MCNNKFHFSDLPSGLHGEGGPGVDRHAGRVRDAVLVPRTLPGGHRLLLSNALDSVIRSKVR